MRSLALPLLLLLSSACTAEQQICGRMETLCGTSPDDCHQLVQTTKQNFGDEGVTGLKTCFAEAKSCGEATGCMTAKGLKGLGAAIGDFVKGVLKGLDDKK